MSRGVSTQRDLIVFGVDTYLPSTYTWIRNLYTHIDRYEILFFAAFRQSDSFPLKSADALFTFPGMIEGGEICPFLQLLRRLLRLLVDLSGIATICFAAFGKRARIRLIHGHFGHVAWRYASVAHQLGIPLVVSFYGYDYDYIPKKYPKWRGRYEELFRTAALILTEGEFGRASLIARGADPARVKVHHLGVEAECIPYQVRRVVQGTPLLLIQVASFVEKKGHEILINAIRLLKDAGVTRHLSVTLIGNGPLKSKICSLVNQLSLGDIVTFGASIPYSQLHTELLGHHVFIHPSVTANNGDCEGGAPVVLLDAQATGMPVIATRHCDIPEEVLDGITGLLVPERDSVALAAAILTLIDCPERIAELGTAARAHVIRNYSAPSQARLLMDLYDEII